MTIANPAIPLVRATVPCNGCRACCTSDLIRLVPEYGDNPASYLTTTDSQGVSALARQPNGHCIYLGADGCTIHERAPAMCKAFDCRRWFMSFKTSHDRREMIKKLAANKDVFEAGRKRLHTVGSP